MLHVLAQPLNDVCLQPQPQVRKRRDGAPPLAPEILSAHGIALRYLDLGFIAHLALIELDVVVLH